jgi:hypothetical protein
VRPAAAGRTYNWSPAFLPSPSRLVLLEPWPVRHSFSEGGWLIPLCNLANLRISKQKAAKIAKTELWYLRDLLFEISVFSGQLRCAAAVFFLVLAVFTVLDPFEVETAD